jgi:hypothetical protein
MDVITATINGLLNRFSEVTYCLQWLTLRGLSIRGTDNLTLMLQEYNSPRRKTKCKYVMKMQNSLFLCRSFFRTPWNTLLCNKRAPSRTHSETEHCSLPSNRSRNFLTTNRLRVVPWYGNRPPLSAATQTEKKTLVRAVNENLNVVVWSCLSPFFFALHT